MIPFDLRGAVLASLPTGVTVGGTAVAVSTLWAAAPDTAALLAVKPVAAALRVAADTPDVVWNSPGALQSVVYDEGSQTRTFGQYRNAVLTVAVYAAVSSGSGSGDDLIDAYASAVQEWCMGALREVVPVVSGSDAGDIAVTEAGLLLREVSVVVRYLQTTGVVEPNIETVETEVTGL